MVSIFFIFFRMSYLVVFLFVLTLINLAVSDGGLAVLVFSVSTLVKYDVRLLMKIPWYDSYLTKFTLLTVMTN